MCKYKSDTNRDGGGRVFRRQSPFGAQGRNSWWTKIQDDTNNAKLKVLIDDLKSPERRLMLRAKTQVPLWAYGVLR